MILRNLLKFLSINTSEVGEQGWCLVLRACLAVMQVIHLVQANLLRRQESILRLSSSINGERAFHKTAKQLILHMHQEFLLNRVSTPPPVQRITRGFVGETQTVMVKLD